MARAQRTGIEQVPPLQHHKDAEEDGQLRGIDTGNPFEIT